jgi:predicted RNA binding protein YcfA (HicA-like mRNA interferase family)
MAGKAGMHVQHPRRKPSQGSPQREKRILPMHDKKELKKGTVNGIKKRLGLK